MNQVIEWNQKMFEKWGKGVGVGDLQVHLEEVLGLVQRGKEDAFTALVR